MEILSEGIRKARKQHRCNACNSVIKKGSRYTYQVNIYDGSFNLWKAHRLCDKLYYILNRDYYNPEEHQTIPEWQHEGAMPEAIIILRQQVKKEQRIRKWGINGH